MIPDNRDENPEIKQKNDRMEQWRDLPATPRRLSTMFSDNQLPVSAWKPVQKLAGIVPTGDEWLRFSDLLMLSLGTIFLLVGIVMFFAFNWSDLSKWHRITIVECAVIISTVLAFVLKLEKWGGRFALLASSILMGVALAVISQEYQTGADSYRLFLVWLILISGWVLISRWNVMYLVWMVLLNLTISLYWEQVIYSNFDTFVLTLLFINAGFVFLWDGVALFTQFEFMKARRWFLYVFLAGAFIYATTLMVNFIWYAGQSYAYAPDVNILHPISYLILLIATIVFYTTFRRDLLMLTFSALSLLVVVLSACTRFFYENFADYADPILFFIIMTVITIALTTGMVNILRTLQKRWRLNHE